MADERIVLAYDPADAIAAAGKANQAITENEKTAERAGAAIGKATDAQVTSIVSITDRSQAAINRIVANAERKASLATGSPAERLAAERKLQLSRVSGDQAAVNRVTAAYDKLAEAQGKASAGGSKLGDALRNPMQAASEAIESVVAELGTIGTVALGSVVGLAAAAKASFDLVVGQGRAAEAIANFADQVGISATEAYKLDIQAKIVGSSLEAVSGGYKKLAQGISEGTEEGKKSAAALEKIGVRIYELDGAVRPFGDLFGDIARKIRAIEEPTERAAKVVELFGKSGLSLMPLILQFDESAAAAKRAAAGIDDPLLKSLGAADDAVDELEGSWNSLKAKLAGGILATIKFVQEWNKGPLDYMLPDGKALLEGAAQKNAQAIADTNRKILADEGAEAIKRFRLSQAETEAKLKEKLADVTSKRQAAEQFGPGMGVEAVSKRIALIKQLSGEEAALTAKIQARAKADQEAERRREEAKKNIQAAYKELTVRQNTLATLSDPRVQKVDLLKEADAAPLNSMYEKEFQKAQSVKEQTVQMELSNLREQLAQEEILYQGARDLQLQQVEGFQARSVAQKIAVEQRKADIEKEFLLKNFALKAQLLQADQDIELAKAEENAELRAAINQKYALAGRALTLQTEAAIAAAGNEAVVKTAQILQDRGQKAFDSVKNAADGLFDALVTRTRSWGDLLRNTVLLPALSILKQITSNTIASALTGVSPAGGGGQAGGILGKLGLSGVLSGGLARAGAPGGTPGFAGPVGGATGLSGMLGGAGGFGGGFGGGGAALGINAGALGLGAASLGLFGAFKAGQSGNKGLKVAAPAIGALSGLVGFGSLAYLFPSLLAAGPVGWVAAAAIGATVGLIGVFKKRGEDKLVEKIKAVYGITVDRSFAKNTLMPMIKDQFGGDIEVGIRSPIIRELLSVYRMQSNQSSLGAGLGAMNNVARGVSLTGTGGGVFQNAVNVNGNAYGYGGAIPSSGPVQPFQPAATVSPVALTLQIDGRDVQAAVSRTNQSSNGRRETSAVLLEPLTIFG